jgi:hypothetical protein
MTTDYSICLGTAGWGVWHSLFGEVYISEDAGESWRKVAREFGEIRCIAWLPN